jgi:hypothetical protein
MTKETIEEAALRITLTKSVYDIVREDFYKGFIEGTEYLSGKLYNEEEVFAIIDRLFNMYSSIDSHNAKEWFKQNKKK